MLGRTVLALRLGFALVFTVAALTLFAALHAWLRQRGAEPALAGITVLAVPAFPFAFRFLRAFEQSMLPMCLAMAAVGLVLLCHLRLTPWRLAALTWVGGLLGASYTPSSFHLGPAPGHRWRWRPSSLSPATVPPPWRWPQVQGSCC